MCKTFMDWFIEKFCPVVVMILLIFVIGLISILCYNFIDETKQESVYGLNQQKLEIRQNFEAFVLTGSITSLRLLIVFLLKRRTKMTKKLYYLRSKSFCLLRLL